MALFQAKIGWKMLRKRENKNYRFISFLSNAQQKITKKIKKLKNTIMDSFQAKIGWRRMRKRENKNYSSVPFLSDASQKIPKKIAKKFKKLKKIPLWLHFKPKQV